MAVEHETAALDADATPTASQTVSPPPLRGVFFDLDDTLIGYAEAERHALLAGCALACHANPVIDADALASAIYDAYETRYAYGTPGYAELARIPVSEFRRLLTEDALRALGAGDDPALVGTLVEAYETAEQDALLRFPDADETLRRLRPHVRLGLITNGPSAMQRAKLAALALDGYFDAS
jgi:putative hydrolase of the HAD superfamily